MTDARRRPGRLKPVRPSIPVPPAYLQKLARWVELVALAKQLRRAIEAAGNDGIIEGHWWDALNQEANELLDDLLLSVPEA